jgi:thiol-disulfide isomerase/thioredoxin
MPLIDVNSYTKGGVLEQKVNNDNAIIVYHWNNCGHCRMFMPILHELLERDRNLKNNAMIFELEYGNFDFVPKPFTNVSAFPSIVAYKNGIKKEEFDEQRTSENLRSFIERNSSKKTTSKKTSSKGKRVLRTYTSKKTT